MSCTGSIASNSVKNKNKKCSIWMLNRVNFRISKYQLGHIVP